MICGQENLPLSRNRLQLTSKGDGGSTVLSPVDFLQDISTPLVLRRDGSLPLFRVLAQKKPPRSSREQRILWTTRYALLSEYKISKVIYLFCRTKKSLALPPKCWEPGKSTKRLVRPCQAHQQGSWIRYSNLSETRLAWYCWKAWGGGKAKASALDRQQMRNNNAVNWSR